VTPEKAMISESSLIAQVFQSSHVIAVVGLSADPSRPSHDVARVMQQRGFRIVPVNPKEKEILGQTCFAQLTDIPFAVDIVNVFRRSEDVLPLAQQAVQIGAQCLWQQLGVDNEQAHALAQTHGLVSIRDRCIKIEHARWRHP
jgi:uncharacterized protein